MRLIDANALKEVISGNSYILSDRINSMNFGMFWDGIEQAIDESPTIDAVPVVRCKECQYYHQTFCEIWSKYGTIQTREQGFCYMAERRDDE